VAAANASVKQYLLVLFVQWEKYKKWGKRSGKYLTLVTVDLT